MCVCVCVCVCVDSPDHPLLGHGLAAIVRVEVGQLIGLQIQQQNKGVSLQLRETKSVACINSGWFVTHCYSSTIQGIFNTKIKQITLTCTHSTPRAHSLYSDTQLTMSGTASRRALSTESLNSSGVIDDPIDRMDS